MSIHCSASRNPFLEYKIPTLFDSARLTTHTTPRADSPNNSSTTTYFEHKSQSYKQSSPNIKNMPIHEAITLGRTGEVLAGKMEPAIKATRDIVANVASSVAEGAKKISEILPLPLPTGM